MCVRHVVCALSFSYRLVRSAWNLPLLTWPNTLNPFQIRAPTTKSKWEKKHSKRRTHGKRGTCIWMLRYRSPYTYVRNVWKTRLHTFDCVTHTIRCATWLWPHGLIASGTPHDNGSYVCWLNRYGEATQNLFLFSSLLCAVLDSLSSSILDEKIIPIFIIILFAYYYYCLCTSNILSIDFYDIIIFQFGILCELEKERKSFWSQFNEGNSQIISVPEHKWNKSKQKKEKLIKNHQPTWRIESKFIWQRIYIAVENQNNIKPQKIYCAVIKQRKSNERRESYKRINR